MDRFEVCFVNDRLVLRASAQIELTDRGITLGDAVFETMRVRAGCVINMNLYSGAEVRRVNSI